MMLWNSGWAWWEVSLIWLGMIAFWALLIWLVFALVSGAIGHSRQLEGGGEERRGDDPRRILDERLARGEIDLEEYQRLRDAIGSRDDGRTRAGSGQ